MSASVSAAPEREEQEKREVARVEGSLKAGVALVGACDACSSRRPGAAFAVEILGPLGSRFGMGLSVDYAALSYVRYGQRESNHIRTVALLLRGVPLLAGRTTGYLDLALGGSNRAVGAFAGLGLEYKVARYLRLGPYARIVWAGAKSSRDCDGLGNDCVDEPPFGHAAVFGLGITGLVF